MRLLLRDSVKDELDSMLHEAGAEGKEILQIIMSEDEYHQIVRVLGHHLYDHEVGEKVHETLIEESRHGCLKYNGIGITIE